MKRIQGFTLIELLVTLIILAIVAMVGGPSFRNVVINSQIDSNLNTVRSSFIYARSEAVTKSVPVSACLVTVDGDGDIACADSGDANWEDSWMVFQDVNGDGVFDEDSDSDGVLCEAGIDDCVLRVFGPLEGGSTLLETNGDYVLTFSPRGQLVNPAANEISFQLRNSDCSEGQERTIAINRVGRVVTGIGGGCDA